MLGFAWSNLLKGLAAILCIVGIISLALTYFFPAPPLAISMASGFKGGSYELVAARYKEILARDHVKLAIYNTKGGPENLKLLQDRNSGISAGIIQGGISNSKQASGLLSLGRINHQVFCV